MLSIRSLLQTIAENYESTVDSLSWRDYLICIFVLIFASIVISAIAAQLKSSKRPSGNRRQTFIKFLEILAAVIILSAVLDPVLRNIDNAMNLVFINNVLYAAFLYEVIDEILYPNTSYILYFCPFYVLTLMSVRNKKLEGYFSVFLGIWALISCLFATRYMIGSFFINPLSFVLVALIASCISVFNTSALQKNYSGWSPLAGLRLRAHRRDDDRRQSLARQVALIGIASAFYLQISISPSVQISYYMALLSGLLAIIGFLALIFTFTFEMMNSVSVRRTIAADTKNAQGAIMVLISLSIAGLFVSEKEITFSLISIDSSILGPILIFSFCVIGGAAAIDFTLHFFHRIVDFVTDNNITPSSGISIAFAEMNTPPSYSSVASTPLGLSQMRFHLEEKGDRVLTIEKTDTVSLRRLRKAVVVMPRVNQPVSKSDAQVYFDFVRRGNLMLIMVDQADAQHKKELLATFGIETAPLPQDLAKAPTIFLDLKSDLQFDEIGNFRPIMRNAVMLRFLPKVVEEAKSEGIDISTQNNSLIFREVDGGLVIVVGSIDHWSNQHMAEGDSILFLDHIHLMFSRAFDTQKAIEPSG